MRKLALATYAINASQICNMVLTAFAVPLIIGAEEYGRYATLFAVPAFFQSAVEAYAVLNLTKGAGGRSFWASYVGLAATALLVTALTYYWLIDVSAAAWSVVLGAALIYRSAGSALVYTRESVSFVRVNVAAEFITFGVYAAVLGVGLIVVAPPFSIPLLMIIGASLVAGSYLLRAAIKSGRMPLTSAAPALGGHPVRFLLSRTYEDLTLTLMPLFVASSFGLIAAGEFRIIVSGMKVVSKVFPFRYEVILRGIRSGEFKTASFVKVACVFLVLGLGIAGVLYFIRGVIFLSADTPLWATALSTGMLVTTLAAFPVATLYSVRPIVVSTVAAAATFLSVLFGSMSLFLMMFIAMNAATFAVTIGTLLRQERDAHPASAAH